MTTAAVVVGSLALVATLAVGTGRALRRRNEADGYTRELQDADELAYLDRWQKRRDLP